MKISVVMPSYLGSYRGAASNRITKFCRAVDSVIRQTWFNWELIIVSDGCIDTVKLYEQLYKKNDRIKLVELNKQPLFSGTVRQAGVQRCTGDWICFLDTDDRFGIGHLENMSLTLSDPNKENLKWVYFNDYVQTDKEHSQMREVVLKEKRIGTSNIAIKNKIGASWDGCDGYGHDWTFISKLIKNYPEYAKIYGCAYYVYHLPGAGIDL